ncbi:MAG: hypothetical protein KAQ64_00530 [Candidatus Pacebacteria bacterium]|nr:hypothetical protein [Candidatus Paceibacterota bacterium]
MPGGHIEDNESPKAVPKREVCEEASNKNPSQNNLLNFISFSRHLGSKKLSIYI